MQILHTIFNWLIPFACGSGITFVIKQLSYNKAMKKSMISLLRSQIVSKCETYTKRGYLPEYARYCLEELFKNYQALGGNHGVEKLVNKCFDLPLGKENENE